ncbi:uncharacterized protein LOC134751910 [Cydia strobilella]|uniref:uncharacterized protein LOC134751910 n=1 Tax=Cydia strobilella TaxID=1100964 RepID=UPI0030040C64
MLALLSLLLLTAPFARASSSSERAPSPRAPPALDEELLRDAPLYPPLQYASPDYDPEDPEASIEDSSILVTPELSEDKTSDKINIPDIGNIPDIENVPDIESFPDIGDVNDVQQEIDRSESEVEFEEGERRKRSSGADWDKGSKGANRRVQTADTILNIRGALRDAIGDAGAAPGPRASSRVDAFVIRPAAPAPPPQAQARQAPRVQPSIQPKHRELLVEPHARARIPCELANVTDLRWYRDSELVNLPTSARGGEAMWAEPGGAVIARATRSDAAVWRCEGRDVNGNKVSGKPTELLVYEPVRSLYLAVDGRRLDASNTWVPVRDKMVLEVRCVAEGGVPAPELSWRLLALEPTLDHRPYLRTKPANYSREGVTWSGASVTAARELHNASLQCDAKQRRPPTTEEAESPPAIHSTKLEIHVTYPPSFVISRWPGFGVALWAGGAAALRCDVDANPPARAWWRRDDAPPDSAPPQGGAERGSSTSLRWPALSAQHGGWYRCRASWLDQEYSSIGYYLNVLSPDESSSVSSSASNTEGQKPEEAEEEEVDHQKVDVPLGGSVQLHCPKGSVGCWWRRVLGNASDGAWAPAGSHNAHGVLGIKEALYQEGGEYRCVGARGSDLARLQELKRVTLRVTGAATARAVSATAVAGGGWRLECGACGRALRVLWLLRGRAVPAALTPDLPQHCWRSVLHVTDPDEVWCVAGGAGGGAVAVFPPRAPAVARQTVRALHGASPAYHASLALLTTALALLLQN